MKDITVKRTGDTEVCKINQQLIDGTPVCYLTFPILERIGCVKHLFSTRIGGCSEGEFSTMNLSYNRGDLKSAVDMNYRRIAACLDSSVAEIVCSDQTHTDHIRIVTQKDCGKGIIRPKDYRDVDGLITNQPGIVLATFFADCVPIYLVDPQKKVIALIHSGWRGTVKKIAKKAVLMMRNEFSCNTNDVIGVIGPSICQECYEVSEDVISEVKEVFAKDLWPNLFYKTTQEKYQLNLWETNKQVLLEAGVLAEHIEMTDLCTCCNPELLFSHRASKGERGNLGAFLCIRD